MSNKDKCTEAFKEWYYQDGAAWNAPHVRPVWGAAWHAAVKAEREACKPIEVVLDEKTYALYVENAKLKDELRNALAKAILTKRKTYAQIYTPLTQNEPKNTKNQCYNCTETIRARSDE